jgi:hypothetical protein
MREVCRFAAGASHLLHSVVKPPVRLGELSLSIGIFVAVLPAPEDRQLWVMPRLPS